MKKLLMSLLSVCCCSALTASVAAAALTPEEAAETVMRYISRAEELQYTPIRPAETGPDGLFYVSQYEIDLFGCLGVTCRDYNALEGTALGTAKIMTGEASDGDDDNSVIVWPYGRYIEHIRQWVEDLPDTLLDPSGHELDSDGLCVMDISNYQDDLAGLIGTVMADERFGLAGLIYLRYDWKTIFSGELRLHLEPEAGCEIDESALNTPEYRNLEQDEEGDFCGLEPISYEEAVRLCEQLEQRDDIASAWLIGDSPLSDEADLQERMRVQMTPFVHQGSGDLNLDGRTDICDAVLLARCLAEDATAPVTEDGLAEADLNGDGVLDGSDHAAMLRLLAGCGTGTEEALDTED